MKKIWCVYIYMYMFVCKIFCTSVCTTCMYNISLFIYPLMDT